mmetsp:Transcript_10041/g.45490  ORF Transcript_10041/g.45490 Transcript_10041/m.45490 type:complete len:464 (+) Transcript_10041:854-2245(+)
MYCYRPYIGSRGTRLTSTPWRFTGTGGTSLSKTQSRHLLPARAGRLEVVEERLKDRHVATASRLEAEVPGPDVNLRAHLLGVDVGRGHDGGANEVERGQAELLGVRHGRAEGVDLADDGGETLGQVGVDHDHLVGVERGDESLLELLGVLSRGLPLETGAEQLPPLLLGVLDDEHLILRGVNLGGVELVIALLVGDVGHLELVLGVVLLLGEALAVANLNLRLEILVVDVHEVGPLGGIDEVLVLASERGGDGGDAEVRAGVERLDGDALVVLEEGADDANLGGVIDDVGHEGVEVVAGALVIVGVVEDGLRIELVLPELAARDGEGEGLDGLLARLAEGGSLGHLTLGHELHGDVVFLGEFSRDGLGLALLHGLRGELVRRGLRGVLVGGLQGGLGSARDRVGVGHVAAHGDDDGDHTDDNGSGGEEGGVLLLLLPQKSVILDFGSTHLWYVTSGRRMRARA